MISIRIVYASKSGHAKFVASRLVEAFTKASRSASVMIDKQPAALTRAQDLLDTDVIVLVSSEEEGEPKLNKDMHALLFDRANDVHLDERRVACVSVSGDKETAEIHIRSFREFSDAQHGTLFIPPLLLAEKDLYAYDKEIAQWAMNLVAAIAHNKTPALAKKSSCPFSPSPC